MAKKTRNQIAKEWERLTFSSVKGVRERSLSELEKVLRFEKKLRKERSKK